MSCADRPDTTEASAGSSGGGGSGSGSERDRDAVVRRVVGDLVAERAGREDVGGGVSVFSGHRVARTWPVVQAYLAEEVWQFALPESVKE
jgi:hypothetical protein